MNNVYFGTDGMTSTESNFMANIARELTERANNKLNSVRFYNTRVAIIGSSDKQLMHSGINSLDFIESDLEAVAQMNAFCAWVREALKEKEAQQKEINNMDLEDWIKQEGIEAPDFISYPKEPKVPTEQDIINSWDINRRNKYLKLEAFAATIGKYIHPNGSYSEARKKVHEIYNKPISSKGEGRDTVLYYSEPSVQIEAVDDMFLHLQNLYRGYEKELNQMKAEIKEEVNKLTRKAYDEYKIEIDNYKSSYKEYETKMTDLRNQFLTWRVNELERISKLKITVPDALKSIFKVIKEAGDTSK